jgi:hypothetical protein
MLFWLFMLFMLLHCCVESTLLVSINKRAFDRIFNNDKAKLAEIRIRLVGADVELQHILNHPMGNRLLYEFLKKEMSAENILFLNAVSKFEEIFDRLRRELLKIQGQHQQHQEAVRLMRQVSAKNRELAVINAGGTTASRQQGSNGPAAAAAAAGKAAANDALYISEVFPDEQSPLDNSDVSYMHMSFSMDDNSSSERERFAVPKPQYCVIDYMEALEKSAGVNTNKRGSTVSVEMNNTNGQEVPQQSAEVEASDTPVGDSVVPIAPVITPVVQTPKIMHVPSAAEKAHLQGLSLFENSAGHLLANDYSQSNVHPEAHPNTNTLSATEYSAFVLQQYYKLQKNIIELKEVARKVIDKHIRTGSDCEVNISAACRDFSIQQYDMWLKLSVNDSLRQLQNSQLAHQDNSADETHHGRSAAQYGNMSTSMYTHASAHVDSRLPSDSFDAFGNSFSYSNNNASNALPFTAAAANEDYTQLFKQSRMDISQLLQKDAFQRFKHTAEFKSFIQAIKPFEQQHNVGNMASHGENSVTSTSQTTMHKMSFHRGPMGKISAANSFNSINVATDKPVSPFAHPSAGHEHDRKQSPHSQLPTISSPAQSNNRMDVVDDETVGIRTKKPVAAQKISFAVVTPIG